jgi:structure-specific recognition protein 1
LFVLEKGIFFLPKPPVLLQHDNIEGIRFQRHGGALATARMFDVTITAAGSDYSFANLARVEFDNFVKFLEAKQVPLLNLEEAKEQIAGSTAGTGGMAVDMDEGDEDEEDEEYAPAQEGVGEEEEEGNEEVEDGGE